MCQKQEQICHTGEANVIRAKNAPTVLYHMTPLVTTYIYKTKTLIYLNMLLLTAGNTEDPTDRTAIPIITITAPTTTMHDVKKLIGVRTAPKIAFPTMTTKKNDINVWELKNSINKKIKKISLSVIHS
jgi:hypothetical protein